MKRFLYFFIIGLIVNFIISCKTYNPLIPQELGSNILISQVYDFNRTQFDSICYVERLPNNLSKWMNASLRDYESKKPIHGFMILRPENNGTNNLITFSTRLRISQKNDTIFIFEKRKTELK